MPLRLAEKFDRFISELICFAGAVQTQQAQTCSLGNFGCLELHIVLLKDGTAARKEQQCPAVMSLCCINLGNVEFLTCDRYLLLLIGGKGSAGLLMQRYGLAELSLRSQGNGLIGTSTGDMQINTFTLQRIAFYSTVKQT